jgi:hypothetical protein
VRLGVGRAAAETGVGKVDARWRVIFVKMLRGPGSVGATASVRYATFLAISATIVALVVSACGWIEQ